MTKYRDFNPRDPLPADFLDALNEFIGTALINFQLIIKPTDPTVLQVPAGTDNAQVALGIDGRWRYNTATVERPSPGGAARWLDVYVTASDNSFEAGSPGEVDNTIYSFGLSIVEAGATPFGVDLSRQVGRAYWDGMKFATVHGMLSVIPDDGTVTGGPAGPGVKVAPGTITRDNLAASVFTPLLAALPATPYDGQEVYFVADAANHVVWHLRYDASISDAYKWVYLGGGQLTSYNNQPVGPAAANQWLGNFQPIIAVPRAGFYRVENKLDVGNPSGNVSGLYTDVERSGNPGVSCLAAGAIGQVSLAPGLAGTASLVGDTVALAAGESIRTMVNLTAVGAQFYNKAMRVRPIRVG